MATLYTNKSKNVRKTWLLFSVFLIMVIGVGWGASYFYQSPIVLYIAVIFAVVMNVVAYWQSDKIVLKMHQAVPADEEKYGELHNLVENLAITAGLPKPRVFIVKERQPNAFATGRDPEHSVVAVTEGLLDILDRSELEGVLAHELSHIGNRDMLISTAAVVLVGFISILADFFMRSMFFRSMFGGSNRRQPPWMFLVGIVLAILAPLGAVLIQLAISRKREFVADASGALLTRYPDGLASALKKISSSGAPMRKAARNTTAHLWVADPFKGEEKKSFFHKVFQTHPPVEERVGALMGMRDNS